MKTYDAILVFGQLPDTTTWELPSFVYDSLNKALELYNQGVAPHIMLSGGHALILENKGLTQPYEEADRMEAYLLAHGCPAQAILKENVSKDTVANYYFLKQLVFDPHHLRNILQITAVFRVPRLRFLSQKVLGPEYGIDFETVAFDSTAYNDKESFIYKIQQDYLKNVRDGDDNFFKNEFYDSPWYLYWKALEDPAHAAYAPKPWERDIATLSAGEPHGAARRV